MGSAELKQVSLACYTFTLVSRVAYSSDTVGTLGFTNMGDA